jgi:hypothetical protein
MEAPQFRDDVVDNRGTYGQVSQDRPDRGLRALGVSPECFPRRRRRPAVQTALLPLAGAALDPPDPRERPEDRLDILGFQLAAVGQQNELRRRSGAVANGVGEREEGLPACGDGRELGEQIAARTLDARANLLLVSRFEQLSPADVLQIDANEIEVFVRHTSLGWLVGLLDGERFAFRVVEVLPVERLGFLFAEEPFRWLDDARIGTVSVVDRDEPELMRALAPVEECASCARAPPSR